MSSKKADRDQNAPKRNLSAYLLYQNAMRDQFKAVNPGMTFGQLAKYTSAMYAQLPPQEKDAWIARAESDKGRYLHELSTYVPPPGFDSKGDAIMSAPTMHAGVKPKPQKDANAPKRNISAYLLYQNAMREQFKRDNPGMTFGQLAKYTSHMYKNLTPQEKATWEYRSQQDKARYDAEIAGYVPPPGHDSRGVSIEDHHPRKRVKRGTKEPGQPKRASGAYVFFTNDMRPRVLSEYPGIKFIELGRVLGERWRALTPHQKKRYEEIANQDKARFQIEMAQFKATGHVIGHHPPAAAPAQTYHHHQYAPQVQPEYAPPAKKARTTKKEPKDPSAPKRASGAYVFFTNEMRPRILQEYPGIKFVELGRVLGERWRALPPHQKKRYDDLAAQDKIRFQMEMQQYSGGGGPPQAVHVTHHQPPPPPPVQQPQYQHYTQPMHADVYGQAHDIYAQPAYHQQHQQQQWQPAVDPNVPKAAPKRRRKK